jgi:hypothetical protein
MAVGDNQVVREFGGTFYEFEVDPNAIPEPADNVLFYYTTSNCTGTAYIAAGAGGAQYVVQNAVVDGNLTIWGAAPPYSMLNMESQRSNNGACQTYGYTLGLLAGSAEILSTTVFADLKPPFSVIGTGVLTTSKHPALQPVCPIGTLCVVDAKGNDAGLLTPDGFERPIGGTYYQISTDGGTITSAGAYFYYTTSTCTGQAYSDAGLLLPQAEVDPSLTVWGPATPYSPQTIASYYVAGDGCVADGPFSLLVGPAAVLSTTIFSNLVPPFSVTLIRRGNARVALNH